MPENLCPPDHITDMADLARQSVQEAFGSLGLVIPEVVMAEPGQPGHIYDNFAYQEWSYRPMTRAMRADEARWWLLRELGRAGLASEVVREHHAYPSFDDDDRPGNPESRIIDEVISDLLSDEEAVKRILDIHRGWETLSVTSENKILLRMFRSGTAVQNQRNLHDMVQGMTYQIVHLAEHEDFAAYTDSLPGEQERNTLREGAVSGLTA